MIHLDTHIVVTLNVRRSRLSPTAQRLIARGPCRISPIVVLELETLFEIGRLPTRPEPVLDRLSAEIGLEVSDAAFVNVIEAARRFAWTRDPFDRLIVANAMADGAQLVTADTTIREHFADAVW